MRTTASGAALAGSFEALSPELDLRVADVTAEQHLVAGRSPARPPQTLEAEEPDVGDVVLPAAVGAAEMLARTPGTSASPAVSTASPIAAARPRDWVTARLHVSAHRAGDDVAGQLGARHGHADGDETVVERLTSVFGCRREGEVLPVGDTHVELEVTLDLRRAPRNWSVVMSPRRAYAMTFVVPLATPRTAWPPPSGRTARS